MKNTNSGNFKEKGEPLEQHPQSHAPYDWEGLKFSSFLSFLRKSVEKLPCRVVTSASNEDSKNEKDRILLELGDLRERLERLSCKCHSSSGAETKSCKMN